MESLFYVYFRKWCSRASQIAFHDCQKKLQNHVFSRIVHLASTRAPVIAAHWCSGRVLLAPGSSLGAHGSSWWLLAWIYETVVPLSKTYIFHSPGLFWTSPKTYILDHSKCMKTIVLSTSGSKARKPSNQASWGWFWWLGTILHQENILLSDHRSLGHLLVGPLSTHRTSGGPTKKMCLRKIVSMIICPPPLSHPTLCCDLQSRHSTKCNVLML